MAKAATKKKKEKLKTIKCFNCGEMGHFASNCTEEKKDEESVDGDKSGADNLNFDEFEDDESCESGDNHFNLREFEDQDDISTDQDVVSIDDILPDNSFVHGMVYDGTSTTQILAGYCVLLNTHVRMSYKPSR